MRFFNPISNAVKALLQRRLPFHHPPVIIPAHQRIPPAAANLERAKRLILNRRNERDIKEDYLDSHVQRGDNMAHKIQSQDDGNRTLSMDKDEPDGLEEELLGDKESDEQKQRMENMYAKIQRQDDDLKSSKQRMENMYAKIQRQDDELKSLKQKVEEMECKRVEDKEVISIRQTLTELGLSNHKMIGRIVALVGLAKAYDTGELSTLIETIKQMLLSNDIDCGLITKVLDFLEDWAKKKCD